jgi:nitrate/TMAO reductase-like tetraheme cytochrome c subunit
MNERAGHSVVLVLLGIAVLMGTLSAHANQPYSEEDANACLDCHETDSVMGILETVHAEVENPKTPAAQRECQSCHGPSATHMKFPLQVENVRFGKKTKSPPAEQNKQCLECHSDGDRENWKAGAHGFSDIVCSTCHSIHSPKAIVPREAAEVVATCTDGCHEDLMADAEPESFSHAIGQDLGGQGTISCAVCHNPHGSLDSVRCGDCHEQTAADVAKQSAKAQRFHAVAEKRGTECIRCHKGIAHPIKPLLLEQAEQNMQEMLAE